ncbi:MAG: beta-ketoacyl-ACP synthase II [Candidatus Pacebacteria bacterium]|nr:beta-ketoacyl-ACP synthase II [Candidatus Paceibacterota bacterium]
MNDDQRIVVTGIGAVTSLGTGTETFWENALAGQSGVRRISQFDAGDMRCQIAGEIPDFDVTKYMNAKEARRLDAFCHYAVAAADEAITMSGLNTDTLDTGRAGVLVGAGIGGIRTLEKQAHTLDHRGPGKSSPLMVPMMIIDMASGAISIRYGLKGPNIAVVTACASGAHAIGEAMWMIRRGDADVMVSGGAEACLCRLGLTGFCAMKALSERNDDPAHASRPFDAERDGFVPSEGAGVLVLESLTHAKARGADILAELTGYGTSGDAYHITAPDPEGDGACRAIAAAMGHAQLSPANLDYINAHGTSTPLNDKMETAAIKRCLGDHAYKIPVSSIKSMTGHGLGAAGGIEAVATILSLKRGVVLPTINYEVPDPECDLDYVPNTPREMKLKNAMSINLGFGGHNAALIFKRV